MLWKNGAKAAFALGFDLDGATIWRNKAERLPGGSAFIKGPSIGEYGLKVGAHRIMEILDEYDIKATWFIPAEAMRSPTTIMTTEVKSELRQRNRSRPSRNVRRYS